DGPVAHQLGSRLELAGWRPGDDGQSAALVTAVHASPLPPAVPGPPIPDDQARPWLPASVYQRLRDDGEQLLGELRSVVALFARFGGIDYAAEDAADRLDAYARYAQITLEDYGGTLWNIAVDAKGSYLCVGFGAPLAHDDDPLRAAAAALVLRAPPAAAGAVEVGGIGLARGRLYAGPYGGVTRRTFGLQGSKMILAARLMQAAAPGQILVEEPLARLIEVRNDLRPHDPQPVKGRTLPVDVRELVGPRRSSRSAAASPAAPDMVGRRPERAALDAHLDQLLRSAGGVLVVEGEPGIGKSRLIRHLTDRAHADGVAVHAGAGDPIQRGAPYHGWGPVFAGALGLEALPDAPDDRRRLVRERMAAVRSPPPTGDEDDLAALLSAVLPQPVAEGPVSAGLSGGARGEATRDLLADLLAGLARAAPTLVVLEDAHWLDSASLALALRLAVAPGPLLLVLTTRPLAESARPDLDRLVATPGCDRMRVGPLPPADVVELAGRSVGGALPPVLAALIEAKAAGNPLFACELAYALRDAGFLDGSPDGRRSRPADFAAIESPDTVATVIASRLDRLPPAAHTLLKVASVLGLSFAEAALAALAGSSAAGHRAHLEQLELLGPAGTSGTIAFRHALIRDVVYSQLLYAQRRDLHRRAAEYYEATGGPGSTPAALAHHWEHAEVPARAVEYLAAAGEAALRAGAFEECRNAYERALALTPGEPEAGQRAEWTWFAAQACYRLGQIDRSLELGARAIAGLDRPVPAGGKAAVVTAAVVESARQFLHRALPRLLPSPAPPEDRHALRLAVEALAMMAEVYYVAADTPRSSYVALRALNLAERLGPSGELAGCYGTMCVIAGISGMHRLAERYAALSRRTSASLEDPYWRALSLQQVCHYRSGVGPYGAFSELYATAVDEYRRLGHRPRLRDTAGMAGIAAHQFGRPQVAERRFHELLAAVEPQEATLGAAWAELWLGMIELRRGRPAEALARLRTADELRDREAVDVISVNVHAIAALARRRTGDDAGAAREDEAARSLIAKLGRRPAAHFLLDGYSALAELALAGWDEAPTPWQRLRARRRTYDARRNLRAFARVFPTGEPARWLYEGERAWRLRRPDPAIRAWEKALGAASRLDMRHELALAHLALGDHLPDGSERDRQRMFGAQLLAELGAPPTTRAVSPRSGTSAAPVGSASAGGPRAGSVARPRPPQAVGPVRAAAARHDPDAAARSGHAAAAAEPIPWASPGPVPAPPGGTLPDRELPELLELVAWSRANRSRAGYFAALYTHVSRALELALDRGEFEHPEALRRLNDAFFERYLTAFRAHRDGQPTTAAWGIAFESAHRRRLCVLQHLMLGMNAHINLDLAIAVAETIPPAELADFRPDFDHMNGLLSSLVTAISNDLALAWPLLAWINRLFRDEDDVIVDFSMRLARDQAWTGALRLSTLAGADRARAIHELDADAAVLAGVVANPIWPANLIALAVRVGERGSVVEITDDLLRM
ncbi:MAG: hypothetical protein QOE27_2590, partial [Solirubrobacteraceae bacterium]|nr:hypothetical protein [Solirubrobacteraceae bacterium]